MSKGWEFNQSHHDYSKWEFEKDCAEICEFLLARRTLGAAEIKPEAVDDAIFAAGFCLARLFDGKPINTVKQILREVARQIDAVHRVDVHRFYSWLKAE